MARTTTMAGQASKHLRKQLKTQFPEIKFSVRSKSYSGGNSITVESTDLDPVTVEKVNKLVDTYQYGHFDGMNDIYEYSNKNEDLPQVKFTFYRNEQSPEMRKRLIRFYNDKFAQPYNNDDYQHYQTLQRIFHGRDRQDELVKEFWGGENG